MADTPVLHVPPQVMRRQVQGLAGRPPARPDSSLPAGWGDGQGQSLPVLEAFHRFLEVERRRARSRLVAVGICSVVLMIVVAGVSLLAGMALVRRVNRDVADVRSAVQALQTATATAQSGRATADADLVRRLTETETGLSRRLTEEAETLRQGAGRTAADVTSTRAVLEEYRRRVDGEFVGVRTTLDALRKENGQLREELKKVRTAAHPPAAKPTPAVAVATQLAIAGGAPPPAVVAGPAAKPAAPPPEPGPSPTPAPSGPTVTLALTLPDPAGGAPIPWRLPLPE